jgi:hypothetical protein
MQRKTSKHTTTGRRLSRRHLPISRRRWPELFEAKPSMLAAVRHDIAAGRLRPLGLGLYTSNLADDPMSIIERQTVIEVDALQRRLAAMRHRHTLG